MYAKYNITVKKGKKVMYTFEDTGESMVKLQLLPSGSWGIHDEFKGCLFGSEKTPDMKLCIEFKK